MPHVDHGLDKFGFICGFPYYSDGDTGCPRKKLCKEKVPMFGVSKK